MLADKSLGKVVREIPALVALMNYIEQDAASIYVRDSVDGQLGNYALSDLPAPQALHWAFQVLRNCSIPDDSELPAPEKPDWDDPEEEPEEEQDDSEDSDVPATEQI